MPINLTAWAAAHLPLPGFAVGEVALVVTGVLLICVLATWIVFRRLVVYCPPSRLAVFSGRGHRRPDGVQVGYRLCTEGRIVRIPFLERLDFIDTTSLYVQIRVERAYLADGAVPVDVELAANVRVTVDPIKVHNAVERLLGLRTEQVAAIAREVLEGCARQGLAQMTREEAEGDPDLLAQTLAGLSEGNLSQLGLELDMLHVVSIDADPRGSR